MPPKIVPIADLALNERVARYEGADHGAQVSAFVSRNPPGTGATLHHHPYEETFVVLDGTVTFHVDGEDHVVEGGNIVIVPPEAVHGFTAGGEGRMLQVSIHPSPRVLQESDTE